MVAPIVGPINVNNHVYGTGPGTRFLSKKQYRQSKPYDLTLPYSMSYAYAISGTVKGTPREFPTDMSATSDTGGQGCCCSGSPPSQFAYITSQAVNLARAKFMGNLHDTALMGVNIAERVQATTMISRRTLQLLELSKLIAAAALGKPKAWVQIFESLNQFRLPALKKRIERIRKDWRQSSKSMADLWLEFHFGWEPLVNDVHAAIALLDTPVPTATFREHSRALTAAYTIGRNFSSREWYKAEYRARARATVFGAFAVTNMDLYRAQRMGLTNPFVLGLELIPFSFIVGWFTTLSEYLEQFDGTLGLRLINVGYSTKLVTSCNGAKAGYGADWATTWTLQSEGCYFNRFAVLPSVTLGLRPPKRLSVARGATAVSLLVQQLQRPSFQKPIVEMSQKERRASLNWTAMPFTP